MDKRKISGEIKEFLASMRKQSIIETQTPAQETDPEYEIKNYPRLLQLARAGLVPDELVAKMSYVLKDPKRFGVSPKIRNQLYDLMIKTLNYIVVSDPAAWARFRAFLVNEEFKEMIGEEVTRINPTKKSELVRNQISEKKNSEIKPKKQKSSKQKIVEENKINEKKFNESIVPIVEEKIEAVEEPKQELVVESTDHTPTNETFVKNKTIEIDYPNESNNCKLYKELSDTVEEVLKKELAKYSMYA